MTIVFIRLQVQVQARLFARVGGFVRRWRPESVQVYGRFGVLADALAAERAEFFL